MQKKLRSTVALCVFAALAGTGVAFAVTGLKHYDYRTVATVRIDAASASAKERKAMAGAIPGQVLSDESLDRIARDLRLDANPVFMGTEVSATGVMLDLLVPREVAPSEREALLRKRLASSLGVTETAGNIAVVATTTDPQLSATLSNHVADSIVSSTNTGSLTPVTTAPSPLAQKRLALETAEADLSAFEAASDNNSLAAMQDNQGQLAALKDEIDSGERNLADIRLLSEQASKITTGDVFTRSLPDDNLFLPLIDIRQRYAAAKVALEEVSISHGPKHPRVIAANDALSAVRASAEPVLKRLQTDIRQQEKQAATALDNFRKKRAALLAGEAANGQDAEQFRALHAALEAARNDYVALMNEGEATAARTDSIFSATVSARADAAKATTNRTDSITIGLIGALCGLACAIPFLLAGRLRVRGPKVGNPYREARRIERDPVVAPARKQASRPQGRPLPVQDDEDTWIVQDDVSARAIRTRPARDIRREAIVVPDGNHAEASRPRDAGTARQAVYYEAPHFAPGPVHAANSDVSVADRVMAVLASGGSGRQAVNKPASDLPPLLAAAMRGDIRYQQHGQDMRQPLRRMDDLQPPSSMEPGEDLEEVRREMAELSKRVRRFASRRGSSR